MLPEHLALELQDEQSGMKIALETYLEVMAQSALFNFDYTGC